MSAGKYSADRVKSRAWPAYMDPPVVASHFWRQQRLDLHAYIRLWSRLCAVAIMRCAVIVLISYTALMAKAGKQVSTTRSDLLCPKWSAQPRDD